MKAFLKDNNRFALTEKAVFYLLIILAVGGMTVPILLGNYHLSLLGSYLGIPMILAPVIWHKIKKNPVETIAPKPELGYVFCIIFFLCYSVSILLLRFMPVRSIGYYFLVTVMGLCILGQIIFSGESGNKARTVILIQTILLVLNIIWGVNLKYYFFIGRTDIIHHSWLAQNLINTGHIGEFFQIYAAFPLWHILCSVITQICGLSYPPYTVMFLINGVVYSLLVILVYLAVNKLVQNEKIALLSALFLCLNPDVLFYGMYSIPRSAVFFLEMLLIYLMLQERDIITVALMIFTALAIVMYHPASIPFVLLILVIIYFLQRLYKIKKSGYLVTLNYLFLVIVMTLTYWLFYGQEVFRAIVKNLVGEGPTGVLTKSILVTPFNKLFNYLQYSPLLFFLICGVLYVLNSQKLAKTNILFYITALGLAFVTFPGPALLINKIARNFNFIRFGEYSFFFICLAGATGLYILLIKLKNRQRIGAALLFALMVFLGVSNDFNASDNPLVKRPFYTYYFTESEITAMNRLGYLAKGYVTADYPAARYMEYSDFPQKAHILEVSALEQKILTNSSDDLILIRKDELSKRPLKLYTSADGKFRVEPSLAASQDYYGEDSPLWDNLDEFNSIYDSGTVCAAKSIERMSPDEDNP